MTAEYRIPKRAVKAQVMIGGEPPRELQFFVGPRAAHHDAGERPSDVLNGSEAFVPVRDAKGQTWLLNLDAVLVVTVAAHEENMSRTLEFQTSSAACLDVVMGLEGSLRVRGSVRYVLPEGQQRLQNYLRQAQRFVALHDGPWVHLVNRHRVIWVQCPATDAKAARGEPLGTAARP